GGARRRRRVRGHVGQAAAVGARRAAPGAAGGITGRDAGRSGQGAGDERSGLELAAEIAGVVVAVRLRPGLVAGADPERAALRVGVVAAGLVAARALRVGGAALGAHALQRERVLDALRPRGGAVVVDAAGIADLPGAHARAVAVHAVAALAPGGVEGDPA